MKDELLTLLNHSNIAHNRNEYEGKHNLDTYKDYELFSVFLELDHFNDETAKNPHNVRKIPICNLSEIDLKARDMLRGYDFEKIWKIVRKHVPDDTREQGRMFDYHYSLLVSNRFAEAEEKLCSNWVFYKWMDDLYDSGKDSVDEDSYDDDIDGKKIIIKYKKEYDEFIEGIRSPRYIFDYEIIYKNLLPNPLFQCRDYTMFMQFYFMKNDKELLYAIGSTRGSYSRLVHGYMSHTFAELENNGKKIKTFLCKLDENANFLVEEKYDQFAVYDTSLTGNYAFDYNDSDKIFKNIKKLYPHKD